MLDPIVRVLRRGIWSPDKKSLHGAVRATATAADLPLIHDCLGDPSPLIRGIGAAALGGLPAGDADKSPADLLDDADPSVAMLAAEALVLRKDVRCLPAFGRWLDAEDFLTRYRSHAVLLPLDPVAP